MARAIRPTRQELEQRAAHLQSISDTARREHLDLLTTNRTIARAIIAERAELMARVDKLDVLIELIGGDVSCSSPETRRYR